MRCGLLGRKLGHSYSPQIHALLDNYSYDLYEQEPDTLKQFFTNTDLNGLNVTIPYKKDVIPFCSKLSPIAQKLGSVNTIIKNQDGTFTGHNTDYYGFMSMLNRTGLDVANKKVLVLGSGGASVTVIAVLQQLKANVIQVSRSGKNNYTNLHLHNDTSVIVNATPVGMYPENGVSPVRISDFPKLEGVLDLIYNPARTQLLMDAEQHGLKWENGLWMLIAQAKESAEWFGNKQINDDKIQQIYDKLTMQMQNIVLIGMPGCGKSTIGKLIAEKTGRTFIDADQALAETAGKSIPEIFKAHGEPGFRKLESEVLRQLGKRSGCVIATGGGCVTKAENYASLHQNGKIIWIQRQLTQLPTEGRPLSQQNDINTMYQTRRPLYEAFSDVTVSNDDLPEIVADRILKLL